MLLRCVFPVVFLFAAASLSASWPGFRGPRGDGVARGTAPLEWSREAGILWRTPLPRAGNGSPVVSGGKVFIAGAEDAKGMQRSLYCFDALTGKQDWVKTVEFARAMPTHGTNPHCSSTPAVGDGKVVVWHASAGLYCYDFYGVEEWHKELGEFRHMWGHGASPVLDGGVVYLYCGPGEKNFVIALELKTGKAIWKAGEALEGGTAERTPEKQYRGSWATPIVAEVNGQRQLICALPTHLSGYDMATGALVWRCEGLKGKRGELAYSSPMMAADTCVVIGGFTGPSLGVKPGRDRGGVKPVWRVEKNPQSIGTGVFHDGFLYVPDADPPGLRCIDPKDGQQKWHTAASGKNFWGSVVLADGRAYATDQVGNTHVFEPSPDGYKQLAVNALKENCNTTPAISGGKIYIRTDSALYCIDGK